MKTISSDLAAHLALEVTTLATCWRLTRKDGVELFLTDHDQPLVIDGNTYEARSGFTPSAISSDLALSADNFDVLGMFDTDAITDADLRGGLYDNCEVRVFRVNWANLANGTLKIRRAFLGEVTLTEQGFYTCQFRSMTQLFNQDIGDTYQPECRADLGDSMCKMPILPDLVQRSTAYAVGDCVRSFTVEELGPVYYTVPNANMEISLTFPGVAWQQEYNNVQILNASPAHTGSKAMFCGFGLIGTQHTAIQDIALDPGLWEDIDGGTTTASLSWYGYFFASNRNRHNIELECQDGTGLVIGVLTGSGMRTVAPYAQYNLLTTSGTLPVGTRVIRIRCRFENTSTFFGDSYIDDLGPLIVDSHAHFYDEYHNVYYECTTAGTTASSAPTFGTTVDGTTADGTVVWTARNSWARAGTVVSYSDAHRVFTCTLTEPRAVDGWFDNGAVIFRSGENEGRVFEVKSWTAAGVVTLRLPSSYAISLGDRFEIYPGCNKRFKEDCVAKFNNGDNFRGEPKVPGQDTLILYPDAN